MDSRKTASQSDKRKQGDSEATASEVNGIRHVIKKDGIKNYKLWVLMDLVGCMHGHKLSYFPALQS